MGKVLLISGAGGGLGSKVAMQCSESFGELVLLGRTRPPLEALCARLGGGATAHMVVADVSRHRELGDALSPFAKLDGLVNAAGMLGPVEKFGDEKWDEWARTVDVNLVGNAALCHYALPKMRAARRGKIVNFAGGGSAYPRAYHSAYAASKTAMVRFTEILAQEHPEIDANIIAPGAHNTGIWKTETHDKPPGKWADAARFCDTVSFLLSEKSDGISGKFIHINDKWEEFTPGISKSGMYTLRRMEPER